VFVFVQRASLFFKHLVDVNFNYQLRSQPGLATMLFTVLVRAALIFAFYPFASQAQAKPAEGSQGNTSDPLTEVIRWEKDFVHENAPEWLRPLVC
jgi:hypothetical protein